MGDTGYVLDSRNECDRLERQAVLDGLERHLRHLPALSEATLLDAGCGSGALARVISACRPNFEVVGVDVNPAYVSYAQDRARDAALGNVRFEQGDLERLNFASASFDVVWSRFVLYFLKDPQAAIAEFRRLIRPGGTLIVSLHNWSTLINYPEDRELQDRQRRVFGGIADMSLAPKLPSLLTVAGFCHVDVEIELDPIYTAIGRVGEQSRRNFSEVFHAGIDRVAKVLGGRQEAESFIADSLAYLDRPDTYTYSLLWTVKCVVPS